MKESYKIGNVEKGFSHCQLWSVCISNVEFSHCQLWLHGGYVCRLQIILGLPNYLKTKSAALEMVKLWLLRVVTHPCCDIKV